jgi:ornithine cyclodeaminase/alanine dehydrogenase
MLPHALPSLQRITVVGRDAAAASRFCEAMGAMRGMPVLAPTEDREQAVRDADVVITVTTAVNTRLLEFEWLRAGCTAVVLDNGGKETGILYAVDRVLVDDPRSFQSEEAIQRFPGGVPPIAATIGEILLGQTPARTADDERILILNLGIAAADIALAVEICERARVLGRGTLLPG